MNAYLPARLDGSSLVDLWRRQPWLLLSLGAHAVLVASLVTAGPVRIAVKRDDGVRVQVAQSLARTAQRQMQRELRAMEDIRDALAQSAGEQVKEGGDGAGKAKAADPAARAHELTRQIDAVREKTRALEIARLLKIPEAEARKRVRAEMARRPSTLPPKQPTPQVQAAQVAQLLQQAKDALAQRRAELLAQQQGVPVKPASEGAHGGQRAGAGKQAGARTASTGGAGPGNGKTGGQGNRPVCLLQRAARRALPHWPA
jgi:hypothetical protein